MYIIILNINNIFDIIFKYKYNFFIKLYLNNYIKVNKLLTYIIKYYSVYNKNLTTHIKNRSKVNFSNRKIRVQKGLGKARIRNFSSPICKQGGSAFGPLYVKNIIKFNCLTYKLVFMYLFINKRSNIIIIKFENLLKYLFIIYNNIHSIKFINIIEKILYFKGIIKNCSKYIILNFNNINISNNIFKVYYNKFIILNLIRYNYLIFII